MRNLCVVSYCVDMVILSSLRPICTNERRNPQLAERRDLLHGISLQPHTLLAVIPSRIYEETAFFLLRRYYEEDAFFSPADMTCHHFTVSSSSLHMCGSGGSTSTVGSLFRNGVNPCSHDPSVMLCCVHCNIVCRVLFLVCLSLCLRRGPFFQSHPSLNRREQKRFVFFCGSKSRNCQTHNILKGSFVKGRCTYR